METNPFFKNYQRPRLLSTLFLKALSSSLDKDSIEHVLGGSFRNYPVQVILSYHQHESKHYKLKVTNFSFALGPATAEINTAFFFPEPTSDFPRFTSRGYRLVQLELAFSQRPRMLSLPIALRLFPRGSADDQGR